MIDRDKVISRLQIIRTWAEVGKNYNGIQGEGCLRDVVDWIDDALVLLKKQEPRVLSKRYMQAWNKKEIHKRSPVVLECRETGYMRWLIETLYREQIDAIGEGDMRFWSSYPTPAQRKEVPWDD